MVNKPKYDWDNIPLGQKSDGAIAKEMGIPRPSVRAARLRAGLPPFERPEHDSERFDWDSLPLGEKSDADIAREYGIKAGSVGGARRRRGIPSFVEEGQDRPARATKRVDWDVQPLGKMPDRLLQRRLGLKSVSSVIRARKYRGIPKYQPPKHKELVERYFEYQFRWDDLEAVEARYKELVAQAAQVPDAEK